MAAYNLAEMMSSLLSSSLVSSFSGFLAMTEKDDILWQYLDEFQNTDTGSHANVIQRAMAEVYQHHPPNASFDKMEVGKVFSAPVSL
jgi:hypothetical protein